MFYMETTDFNHGTLRIHVMVPLKDLPQHTGLTDTMPKSM
jgi:hypothetical protein